MSHCNNEDCISTRRMGACECGCQLCSPEMWEADGKTTLDLQREVRFKVQLPPAPPVVEVAPGAFGGEEQMWVPPNATIEIKAIRGCARCGRDHAGPITARRLTQPFAPAEAGGRMWTHWFPCPYNFEPVLVEVTED